MIPFWRVYNENQSCKLQNLPPSPAAAAGLPLCPPTTHHDPRHPDNSRWRLLQISNPPYHRLFPIPCRGIGSRRWKPPYRWKPPRLIGYLMVLNDIWDINIDWYFKLNEKLKPVSGDGNGDRHVIITSRLPHKVK